MVNVAPVLAEVDLILMVWVIGSPFPEAIVANVLMLSVLAVFSPFTT